MGDILYFSNKEWTTVSEIELISSRSPVTEVVDEEEEQKHQ